MTKDAGSMILTNFERRLWERRAVSLRSSHAVPFLMLKLISANSQNWGCKTGEVRWRRKKSFPRPWRRGLGGGWSCNLQKWSQSLTLWFLFFKYNRLIPPPCISLSLRMSGNCHHYPPGSNGVRSTGYYPLASLQGNIMLWENGSAEFAVLGYNRNAG